MDKYYSRPKFWQRLLSFLICVVMLALTLAAMVIADVRLATNKENTAAIIKQALFASHTVRLPGASGNGSPAHTIRVQPKLHMVRLEEETNETEDNALIEAIFNMVIEGSNGQIQITLEEASEFIEESSFDEFAADLGASLISDLITGENTTVLDAESVTELLTENAPLLEEYFDLQMDETVIQEVTATVVESEYVVEIQEAGISSFIEHNEELRTALGLPSRNPSPAPGDSAENSGDNAVSGDQTTGDTSDSTTDILADYMATARKFTSTTALICCVAGIAVCIVLLCLLNRKHIWFAIRGTGRTFVIASFPMAILTINYLSDPAAWNAAFGLIPEIGGIIGKVVGLILQLTAPINLSVFGVGVFLALLGTVLKIVARTTAKRKAAEENAAPVGEEAVTAPLPQEVPQEILETETLIPNEVEEEEPLSTPETEVLLPEEVSAE